MTVADDWRRRGLAVTLMRLLIDVARCEGFKALYSIDSAENEQMRELASRMEVLKRSCVPAGWRWPVRRSNRRAASVEVARL